MCTLYTRSSKRWAILNQELEITFNPLSETWLKCRLDGLKAIKIQLCNICEVTGNFCNSSHDSATVTDCKSVLNKIKTLEFVLWLITCYKVFNVLTHLWQVSAWLDQYYSTGFDTTLRKAQEFAGNRMLFLWQSKRKEPFTGKRMFHY
jgi:hypothetical protein